VQGVDAMRSIPEKGKRSDHADALKTSAGALNPYQLHVVKKLSTPAETCKNLAILIGYAETEKSMYESDFSVPVAMIMGSERMEYPMSYSHQWMIG